jgi:hypothetical protein
MLLILYDFFATSNRAVFADCNAPIAVNLAEPTFCCFTKSLTPDDKECWYAIYATFDCLVFE